MTVALISLLSVVSGAALQYFFTRHLENQKHYRALRTQAYTDYLKAVCEQAQLVGELQTKEKRELFSRIADAKSRICLYGSIQAVQVFAEFEKRGAAMRTAEQRRSFSNMVAVMRADSGGHGVASVDDLEIVLLGDPR